MFALWIKVFTENQPARSHISDASQTDRVRGRSPAVSVLSVPVQEVGQSERAQDEGARGSAAGSDDG